MHVHQDTIDGSWKEFKGAAQAVWGKLTDDKLEQAKGSVQVLEGILQKEYGMTVEKAREEIDAIVSRYDNLALKGEWNEIKGKIRETWGQLTEDEVERTAGRRSQLVGLVQQRYGHKRSKAWDSVNEFVGKHF